MAITNLTNTTWMFNETLNPSTEIKEFNVNFITPLGELTTKNWSQGGIEITTNAFERIKFDGESNALWFYHLDTGFQIIYYNNWTGGDNAKRITITGGDDVENADLIAFLEANAVQEKPLEFTETKTALKIYEDLSQKEYEGLEKDNNSFYQVNNVGIYKGEKLIATNGLRLDKPSAEWNSETSPTDFQTWLQSKISQMYKGQVVYLDVGYGDYQLYGIILEIDTTNSNFIFLPITLVQHTNGGLIMSVALDYSIGDIEVDTLDGVLHNDSFNSVYLFKLF